MKKLIVIMGMLGLMQSVAAEVYSCGPACFPGQPYRQLHKCACAQNSTARTACRGSTDGRKCSRTCARQNGCPPGSTFCSASSCGCHACRCRAPYEYGAIQWPPHDFGTRAE